MGYWIFLSYCLVATGVYTAALSLLVRRGRVNGASLFIMVVPTVMTLILLGSGIIVPDLRYRLIQQSEASFITSIAVAASIAFACFHSFCLGWDVISKTLFYSGIYLLGGVLASAFLTQERIFLPLVSGPNSDIRIFYVGSLVLAVVVCAICIALLGLIDKWKGASR
jgi:hypothetical protein